MKEVYLKETTSDTPAAQQTAPESKKRNRLPKNSPFPVLPFGGISASALKILAMALMLMDHMWATVIPGNQWMTWVGRLAFPIFAFQAAEGYRHTKDFKKYALRLLIAGLLSEIPFNLMQASSVIYPFDQNVMFTLLLGLLGIRCLDNAKQKKTAKAVLLGILGAAACVLLGGIGFVDYRTRGVLTVILFWVLRDFPFAWLAQLVAMILMYIVTFEGETIPISLFGHLWDFPTQGFCVAALLPIWLYGGRKGKGGKPLQITGYVFYPAHILILYAVSNLLASLAGG